MAAHEDGDARAGARSSRARSRPRPPGPASRCPIDRTAISTKLGHKFVFHSTIRNDGATAASGLVAHLNVVALSGHAYVDPEDWSSHRTRYLASVPPSGSTTLAWPMNAVNSGTIGVYVAVLPRVEPRFRLRPGRRSGCGSRTARRSTRAGSFRWPSGYPHSSACWHSEYASAGGDSRRSARL